MTDIRDQAQAEAELGFWFTESARDEATDQGFATGCDCGGSEANAFVSGAVWRDGLLPSREEIAAVVHEAFSLWHSKRELHRKYPELHEHPGEYYAPLGDAVLTLIASKTQ